MQITALLGPVIRRVSQRLRDRVDVHIWQLITDFERPQIRVKSVSHSKFPRSVVFSMYLIGIYFLLLNMTLLKIDKIQSNDIVDEKEAAIKF